MGDGSCDNSCDHKTYTQCSFGGSNGQGCCGSGNKCLIPDKHDSICYRYRSGYFCSKSKCGRQISIWWLLWSGCKAYRLKVSNDNCTGSIDIESSYIWHWRYHYLE